jgi:hypothetical protein
MGEGGGLYQRTWSCLHEFLALHKKRIANPSKTKSTVFTRANCKSLKKGLQSFKGFEYYEGIQSLKTVVGRLTS